MTEVIQTDVICASFSGASVASTAWPTQNPLDAAVSFSGRHLCR